MKTYAFRLKSGQDLRKEIDKFVKEQDVEAGVILTCVGNLTKAVLRMAEAQIIKTFEGTFEIVSLVGTVEKGNSHLHISIADKKGRVFGGHLKESAIGVTAEVVIGKIENLKFKRKFDENTGYNELSVDIL